MWSLNVSLEGAAASGNVSFHTWMLLEAVSREIVLQDPDNYRFYVNHLGQAGTGIYIGKQESANSQQAK